MYDPPAYVWALTIAGVVAIPAAACVVLYGGAVRAGVGARQAALLAGGTGVVLGGWFSASAVIAGHGWYHGTLSHGPRLPVAVAGFLGALLALSRIPVVARPGGSREEQPSPTPALVPGHRGGLPAHHGLRSPAHAVRPARRPGRHYHRHRRPLVAYRLTRGTGRRAAVWFNAFGMTDLTTALALGGVTAFGLLNSTPSGARIAELPLALIPTAVVPLLFTLHITSMATLARDRKSVV